MVTPHASTATHCGVTSACRHLSLAPLSALSSTVAPRLPLSSRRGSRPRNQRAYLLRSRPIATELNKVARHRDGGPKPMPLRLRTLARDQTQGDVQKTRKDRGICYAQIQDLEVRP
ncbi:hypothetical protein ACQ86L_0620 (plasmid) [Leifsonia sp. P73]